MCYLQKFQSQHYKICSFSDWRCLNQFQLLCASPSMSFHLPIRLPSSFPPKLSTINLCMKLLLFFFPQIFGLYMVIHMYIRGTYAEPRFKPGFARQAPSPLYFLSSPGTLPFSFHFHTDLFHQLKDEYFQDMTLKMPFVYSKFRIVLTLRRPKLLGLAFKASSLVPRESPFLFLCYYQEYNL